MKPPTIPGYTAVEHLQNLIESAEKESCGNDGKTLRGVETLVYYDQGDEVLSWLRWALVTLKENDLSKSKL